MANITRQVKLIFAEAETNNNKVWIGTLFDNGDVRTEWGRVGKSLQSKDFPSKGSYYLDQKKAEKIKKGYTELHTVAEGTEVKANAVGKSNLAAVAKRDIVSTSPVLDRLLDRLIKANIHTIVSETSITYNSTTGLFTTPLGVVTQHAIDESRLLLAEIKEKYDNEATLKKLVSKYLRFIPHDIGMKFNVHSIFPNSTTAVEKELNILDSLQASFDATVAAPAPVVDKKKDDLPESVFKVELDIEPVGSPAYNMATEFFKKTNKAMHGYQNLKVLNVYRLNINHMTDNFDDKKVGGIVQVWHGTSEANLLSIMKQGLKCAPPSSAYIAGKMFGNGIYGSETASKSLGYTMGRWGGRTADSGWLFICKFAMGKPYYPTHTLQRIPDGFNSCWALPGKCGLANDELIVYRDQQVKIEYLLEIGR